MVINSTFFYVKLDSTKVARCNNATITFSSSTYSAAPVKFEPVALAKHQEWGGSFNFYPSDSGDYLSLVDKMQEKVLVDIAFFDEQSNDTYSGKAVITSLAISGAVEDTVIIRVNFKAGSNLVTGDIYNLIRGGEPKPDAAQSANGGLLTEYFLDSADGQMAVGTTIYTDEQLQDPLIFDLSTIGDGGTGGGDGDGDGDGDGEEPEEPNINPQGLVLIGEGGIVDEFGHSIPITRMGNAYDSVRGEYVTVGNNVPYMSDRFGQGIELSASNGVQLLTYPKFSLSEGWEIGNDDYEVYFPTYSGENYSDDATSSSGLEPYPVFHASYLKPLQTFSPDEISGKTVCFSVLTREQMNDKGLYFQINLVDTENSSSNIAITAEGEVFINEGLRMDVGSVKKEEIGNGIYRYMFFVEFSNAFGSAPDASMNFFIFLTAKYQGQFEFVDWFTHGSTAAMAIMSVNLTAMTDGANFRAVNQYPRHVEYEGAIHGTKFMGGSSPDGGLRIKDYVSSNSWALRTTFSVSEVRGTGREAQFGALIDPNSTDDDGQYISILRLISGSTFYLGKRLYDANNDPLGVTGLRFDQSGFEFGRNNSGRSYNLELRYTYDDSSLAIYIDGLLIDTMSLSHVNMDDCRFVFDVDADTYKENTPCNTIVIHDLWLDELNDDGSQEDESIIALNYNDFTRASLVYGNENLLNERKLKAGGYSKGYELSSFTRDINNPFSPTTQKGVVPDGAMYQSDIGLLSNNRKKHDISSFRVNAPQSVYAGRRGEEMTSKFQLDTVQHNEIHPQGNQKVTKFITQNGTDGSGTYVRIQDGLNNGIFNWLPRPIVNQGKYTWYADFKTTGETKVIQFKAQYDVAANGFTMEFNTDTGQFITQSTSGLFDNDPVYRSINLGNGWWRIAMTCDYGKNTVANFSVHTNPLNGSSPNYYNINGIFVKPLDSSGSEFTGDGISGFYLGNIGYYQADYTESRRGQIGSRSHGNGTGTKENVFTFYNQSVKRSNSTFVSFADSNNTHWDDTQRSPSGFTQFNDWISTNDASNKAAKIIWDVGIRPYEALVTSSIFVRKVDDWADTVLRYKVLGDWGGWKQMFYDGMNVVMDSRGTSYSEVVDYGAIQYPDGWVRLYMSCRFGGTRSNPWTRVRSELYMNYANLDQGIPVQYNNSCPLGTQWHTALPMCNFGTLGAPIEYTEEYGDSTTDLNLFYENHVPKFETNPTEGKAIAYTNASPDQGFTAYVEFASNGVLDDGTDNSSYADNVLLYGTTMGEPNSRFTVHQNAVETSVTDSTSQRDELSFGQTSYDKQVFRHLVTYDPSKPDSEAWRIFSNGVLVGTAPASSQGSGVPHVVSGSSEGFAWGSYGTGSAEIADNRLIDIQSDIVLMKQLVVPRTITDAEGIEMTNTGVIDKLTSRKKSNTVFGFDMSSGLTAVDVMPAPSEPSEPNEPTTPTVPTEAWLKIGGRIVKVDHLTGTILEILPILEKDSQISDGVSCDASSLTGFEVKLYVVGTFAAGSYVFVDAELGTKADGYYCVMDGSTYVLTEIINGVIQ